MEIMIVVGNRCIHLPAQVEEAEFVVEVAAFFVGGGFVGGVFWHNYGWNGVGAFIALMLVIALLIGTRLHRRLHA